MPPGKVSAAIFGSIALCTSLNAGRVLAGTTTKATKSSTAGRPRQRGDFERFRNEKDAWKLLNDKQVYRQMRAVAGNDIEHVLDRAYYTQDLKRSADDLFTPCSMIGGAGYTAFFAFNCKTGHVCLGWADDSTWHVYGAGSKLPAPVKEFLDAGTDPSEVKYEKPNPRPVVTFKATPPKKGLNTSNITGTYEREPTRFTTGTLEVQALPGGKVKFSVFANLGGHTGGTEGTATVVERRVINTEGIPTFVDRRVLYKDPGSDPQNASYIEITFRGREAIISGIDEAFCGSGVTLKGTYKKIDDRVPSKF